MNDLQTQPVHATDEAQIRWILRAFEDALSQKDLEKLLAFYASEMVTFDVVPPLRYVGNAAYAKSFQRMFDGYRGPIVFETRDLHIAVGADVAFCHSLVRTSGTAKSGHTIDRWLRRTLCLRKMSGRWLIVHEHVSVPVSLESGSVIAGLRPDP